MVMRISIPHRSGYGARPGRFTAVGAEDAEGRERGKGVLGDSPQRSLRAQRGRESRKRKELRREQGRVGMAGRGGGFGRMKCEGLLGCEAMNNGAVPLTIAPVGGRIEGGKDFRFLAPLGMTGGVGMTRSRVSWERGRGGIFSVWRGVGVRGAGGGSGSGCWVLGSGFWGEDSPQRARMPQRGVRMWGSGC